MTTSYFITAVAVSALITFGLRALPFLAFSGSRKNARITRTTRPGTAVCHHGGTDHLLYERYSHRRYLCRSTETARSSGRFITYK